MRRVLIQPDQSSLCGHCCVAMAAGVSLDRAIEEIGHERGTYTRELVAALRAFGIGCASKLRRLSRIKPVLPKRAIVCIQRYGDEKRSARGHWMLAWDGEIFDPGGAWPHGYENWRITSYLEIR
jgi:hypothetical protein